jgi:hypothetical protein
VTGLTDYVRSTDHASSLDIGRRREQVAEAVGAPAEGVRRLSQMIGSALERGPHGVQGACGAARRAAV